MFRDITIGQYYEEQSNIHSLDPRVKLFGSVCYMIALFLADNIIGYALAAIFLYVTIKISKVPFKFIFKGLKTIVILLLFSVIFSVIFTDGTVLLDLKLFNITAQGLVKGIKLMARLSLMIMGMSILTYTTTPTDIADGLEKAFSPLKKIKVPVHDIAMMVSIAFRFIPILIEETDKIMKAQMARGADFENGGIIKKAKSMMPLIIPLVISSIKRAMDLAMAMEARCYRGGEGRTKMKPLIYKHKDIAGYLCLFALLAVVIAGNILWDILDINIYGFITPS
ncbi:MAG: energy-coupling factor transporter transmembrane protein EcfT [Lachnospiraceae bacterium]|nr:energy-coupling factor transporter transmembrane protein EcfT [Lachnospiraceae bacterium]